MRSALLARWSRLLHRWSTVIVILPLLVILVSGVLLLWKKDVAWIQPPSQVGSRPAEAPAVSFERLLEAARTAEEAGIQTWADVGRLDVRPDRGIAKIRANGSNWEVQVDLATGDVLHVGQRRSDVIEALHDGSFFHDTAKLGLFFPVTLFTLGLCLTGVYLFYLPFRTKRRRRQQPVRPRRTPPRRPSSVHHRRHP